MTTIFRSLQTGALLLAPIVVLGCGADVGEPSAVGSSHVASQRARLGEMRRPPAFAADPAAVSDLPSALVQTAAVVNSTRSGQMLAIYC